MDLAGLRHHTDHQVTPRACTQHRNAEVTPVRRSLQAWHRCPLRGYPPAPGLRGRTANLSVSPAHCRKQAGRRSRTCEVVRPHPKLNAATDADRHAADMPHPHSTVLASPVLHEARPAAAVCMSCPQS